MDLSLGSWLIGPGLSASFAGATAARDGFDALDLVAYLMVVGGVGKEDQPVVTRMGVVVLLGFVRSEYARLAVVHSL